MANQFHDSCLVCQSAAVQALKGYAQHDLLKCRRCGFVFMHKIPTAEELERHYALYAYETENELSEATRLSIEYHLDTFEPYRKNNRLLDVGCGEGWILERAKARGWQVCGTEFSPRAVALCRGKGIKMYAGELQVEQMEEKDFDVLISTETLEHIYNPREEVRKFYQLLRPGGLLYITTPNFNSYLRYLFGSNYSVIEYPEHLAYYTPKTLHRLLQESGFRKKKLQTTGISFSQFQQSKKNEPVQKKEARRKEDRIRNSVARSPWLSFLKNVMNRILTFTGIGVKLKAYYVRK